MCRKQIVICVLLYRLEPQLVWVWLHRLMWLFLLATLVSILPRPLSSRSLLLSHLFVFKSTKLIKHQCVCVCIGCDSQCWCLKVQVLNIPTKINKGTVEIITPVELIKKGDKVGSSEAALLSKLGIRPFSYGLIVLSVYDNGSVFSPEVLDLTEDDLIEKFAVGVSMVTSLSLALCYPTLAAAPHMFTNACKNVLAVAVATEYSYPQADQVKEFLKVVCNFSLFAFRILLIFKLFVLSLICYLACHCRIRASSLSPLPQLQLQTRVLLRLLPRRRRRRRSLLMNPTTTWALVCSTKSHASCFIIRVFIRWSFQLLHLFCYFDTSCYFGEFAILIKIKSFWFWIFLCFLLIYFR